MLVLNALSVEQVFIGCRGDFYDSVCRVIAYETQMFLIVRFMAYICSVTHKNV